MPPNPESIRQMANDIASEIEAQYGTEVPVRGALVVSYELDFATDRIAKRVLPAEMEASDLAELASELTKDPLR
jgi:hypothetical protein